MPFYQTSSAYDDRERATVHYADAVTRGAAAVDEQDLESLKRFYSEDEIVELTLVICAANFVNRFNDALQVEVDVG